MSLFKELKRRNVFRVGIAYVLGAWVLLQAVDFALEVIAAPDWILQVFFLAAIVGLVVALVAAWVFEVTPEGIRREAAVDPGHSITSQTGRKLDRTIIVFLALAVALLLADRFMDSDPELAVIDTVEPVAEAVTATSIAASEPEKSIAVLPFENRSPNPEDGFFADGMHDELLTHLSKISELLVISRTSVMGYAGTDRKIPEIARELGVATIMEGSVQRAGQRVRINVQLIDAQTDAHLWAEIYDRELTAENIFDIQSEITKAIAVALNSALSSDNEAELKDRPTQSLAAYDAYIAGQLLFKNNIESNFRRAIELFDVALAEDQNFAAAWSAKAEALLELYWLFDNGNVELANAAREALDRAARLAPDTVETQNAFAHYYYYILLDYERAIAAFEQVLERAPNLSRAWAGKGFALRRAGRFVESIATLEHAHSLDPLAVDPLDGIVATSLILGQFDKARTALEKMQAIAPNNANTVNRVGDYHFSTGNVALSWTAYRLPVAEPDVFYFTGRLWAAIATRNKVNIELAINDWPEHFHSIDRFPEIYNLSRAEGLIALGRTAESARLLNEIKARVDSSDNPYPHGWKANGAYLPVDLPGLMGDLDAVNEVVAIYKANEPADKLTRIFHYTNIAVAYSRADDPDSALDYLEQILVLVGPARFLTFTVNPAFDSLRNHPRYLAMQADYEAWAGSL